MINDAKQVCVKTLFYSKCCPTSFKPFDTFQDNYIVYSSGFIHAAYCEYVSDALSVFKRRGPSRS